MAEAIGKGEILRRLHWRCWRQDAPPVDVSLEELVEVLPAIVESGSVGLVWPRLGHRAEEFAPAGGAVGAALQAAYEAQVAHNARVEAEIARVVGRLRGTGAAAGVEPVLIKGYAVARLYPFPLVRTAGDIDLVVRDGDYEAAKVALTDLHHSLSFHCDPAARRAHAAAQQAMTHARDAGELSTVDVDLHRVSSWYGATADSFVTEAERVQIGGVAVRVPRAEDHLRALCLHFLRHGAVRPLRLCDIALLIESNPALDPERLLRGTAREQEQIVVTLRLAEALLGAPPPSLPDALPAQLPAWLVPAVLRQWGENPQRRTPHVRELLGGPGAAYRALANRWPDPISAVIRTSASFERAPDPRLMTRAYAKHFALFAWNYVRR